MQTEYRCDSCGATDFDHGVNPPAPMVLNCYQCKSGRGQDISTMLGNGLGMKPVAHIDTTTGERTPLQ